MPARNILFLFVVTAACLAAWSVRDRDPAARRLGAVLAAADRVSLDPIDRDALIDAAVATVVARLDEDALGVGAPVRPVTVEPGLRSVPREITVVREIILPETVVGDRRRADGSWRWHLEDAPGIAVVRIMAFGDRTAAEFDAALATIAAESGAAGSGLVIDLRGTEGGSLSAAVAVCDRLLDEGVIVATRRRRGGGTVIDVVRATPDVAAGIRRLAVLVDHRTAGVAEVVAACLQDHGRAAVVGGRTAGRGAVQTLVAVGDGSQLRLTTAEYLRPAGAADPSRGRLHRHAGADETARWGVAPDPGLSLEPTGATLERLASWRRDRDTPARDSIVIQAAAVGVAAGGQPAADPTAVVSAGSAASLSCAVDPVLAAAVDWIRTPATTTASSGPVSAGGVAGEPVSNGTASETGVDLGGEKEAAGDTDEAVATGA